MNTLFPSYITLFFISGGDWFSLVASLIISVYWFKLCGEPSLSPVRLRGCKTVSFLVVASVTLIVIMVIPCVLRLYFPISQTQQMLLLSGCISGGVRLLMALYFIVSGVKLQMHFSKASGIRVRRVLKVCSFTNPPRRGIKCH